MLAPFRNWISILWWQKLESLKRKRLTLKQVFTFAIVWPPRLRPTKAISSLSTAHLGTRPFPSTQPNAGRAPNLPTPDNTRPQSLKTGTTRAAKNLLRMRRELGKANWWVCGRWRSEKRTRDDRTDCVKKDLEELKPQSTWETLSTVYLELTPLNSQNTRPVIASFNLFVSRTLSWLPRHKLSDTVLRYALEKTSTETKRPSLTSQALAGAGGGASDYPAGQRASQTMKCLIGGLKTPVVVGGLSFGSWSGAVPG